MRNLKKFLALVLAMMMVFSLMVTVNAAATFDGYTDASSVNARYKTAVEVLTNIGVFHGTNNGSTFSPDETITRAEMAAIIYRVMTGDVRDKDIALYKDYDNDFEDVTDEWFAPYVNYANNARIVVGDGNGHFYPLQQINGYQVLAILLRALGYDQPGEFTGKDWDVHTAQIAAQLHITDNLAYTLRNDTPRQVVAQMTYNTTIVAPRMRYTPAGGYSATNEHLIDVGTASPSTDVWGVKSTTTPVTFTYPEVDVPGSYTINAEPLAQFYGVKTQCDVADEMIKNGYTGFTATNQTITLDTYTNGANTKNLGGQQVINDLDTTNTIGHSGRWTRVYADRIVYVDTFLAEVTNTTDATYDLAGHEITPATATLKIYSNDKAAANTTIGLTPAAANSDDGTVTYSGSAAASYTEGDILRVNLVTPNDNDLVAGMSRTVTMNGTTYARVQSAVAINPTPVTVKSILTDADNNDTNSATPGTAAANGDVGFVGTNGVKYYYNYTFGYNTAASSLIDRVVRNDIDTTFNVYTDARGTVIGITPVVNATTMGVGVLEDVDLKNIKGADWALVYTIRLHDGSVKTIEGSKDGQLINTITQAESDVGDYWDGTTTPTHAAGILVLYVMESTGYYSVTKAGEAYAGSSTSVLLTGFTTNTGSTGYKAPNTAGAAATIFEAGEADTLGTGKATTVKGDINSVLVDDDTQFFVANYGYNYSYKPSSGDPGTYQFKSWSLPTGFKNIYDMSYINTAPNGTLTYAATVDGDTVTNGLEISSITLGDTTYVLVLNDNQQKVPATYQAKNYAYLMTNGQAVETGNDYSIFPAIINGQSRSLQVTGTETTKIVNTGLYTYAEQTTNGWTDVKYVSQVATGGTPTPSATDPNYYIAKGDYSYAAGVLYVTGSSASTSYNADDAADAYLTVANSAQVFLLNPTTGNVHPASLSYLNNSYYSSRCGIVYQFDTNGYINYIYIIDSNTMSGAGSTADITAVTIATTATSGTTANLKSVSAVEYEVTTDTPTSSVDGISWKFQRLLTADGVTWVDCANNEVFNTNYSYRVVFTLTAADGYVFNSGSLPTIGGVTSNGDEVVSANGSTLTFSAAVTVTP